jgi:trk system potassium uptake protein TrkH
VVALFIAAAMALSVPWEHPVLGATDQVETRAIGAIVASMGVASLVGVLLLLLGRRAEGTMFRKEALAVVGLSWLLAATLGALPFLFSNTCKGPAASPDSAMVQGVPMTPIDALFESASGFTGTGATVITDLEDPKLVPRAILFWRSETHFLGGLGIMVLFVALLGQGSAGKAIYRAEIPGPHSETSHARVQHSALAFAGIYIGLNVILTALLLAEGMILFDAVCHSFGTIATGGFSTYNASIAQFDDVTIEMTISFFMAVSCVNFTLLYLLLIRRPKPLLRDREVRAYLAILFVSTVMVAVVGLGHSDFRNLPEALRYGSFQVISILTNTGFATHDFDQWSQFGRGWLFLLMFVGGCAGSTSCSIKVIRHLILWKALGRELERAYRPNVVRPVRIGDDVIEQSVVTHVFFYFGLFAFIFAAAWLALLLFEPDKTWTNNGHSIQEKYIDCASGVAATINGVGPGLGTIGATKNYAHFQPASKLILSILMLLGRLEMIPILVLLAPKFWKSSG